jgi:two-component system, NarL family, response regulator NreC
VGRACEEPIGIVLADDHAIVRRALRLLLEAEHDFRVVAEAQDVDSARALVREWLPAVLVLDLLMPGNWALDAIPAIRSEAPATEIVILTMVEEPMLVRHALEAGAAAYVLKDAAAEELADAVRCAAAGGRYVHGRARAALRGRNGRPVLSPREVGVLRLLALGHTNAEIARQLRLSTRTIETHRSHIHTKLEVSTRAELVQYAFGHGVVEGAAAARW